MELMLLKYRKESTINVGFLPSKNIFKKEGKIKTFLDIYKLTNSSPTDQHSKNIEGNPSNKKENGIWWKPGCTLGRKAAQGGCPGTVTREAAGCWGEMGLNWRTWPSPEGSAAQLSRVPVGMWPTVAMTCFPEEKPWFCFFQKSTLSSFKHWLLILKFPKHTEGQTKHSCGLYLAHRPPVIDVYNT